MLQILRRRSKDEQAGGPTDSARTPTALNFIRLRESMLEASLRYSGLREHRAWLGDDHVQYWAGGKGPTLLLLHGFGAHAVWQWYSQVEVLTRHFHVVMPNLLWFGESYSRDEDPSLDHQVRAICALLDHLKTPRVHLCGLSYGGAVAAMLAARSPARLRTLTLVASPAHAYTREDYNQLCQRFGVEDITDVFVPTTVDDVQRLLTIGYKRPPLAPRFALRQVLDVLYGKYQENKRELLRALHGEIETVASEPFGYEGPVKLIWGREDVVFPVSLAHRLATQLGERASLTVLDDARHAPNLEQATEFNAALEEFLMTPR